MYNTKPVKNFIEQAYQYQINAWETIDKIGSVATEMLPKFPNPYEFIEAALKVNKIVSETTQQAITESAKKLSGISKAF